MSWVYDILLYCGKGVPARLDLLACTSLPDSSFTAHLKVSEPHAVSVEEACCF